MDELASDHAEEHGERTGEQHHEKRDRNARNRNFSELLRETEQPEHAEQHDLHEPADAVVETADAVLVDELAVAHDHAADIDRHEAVAVAELACAEGQHDHADAEHVVESVVLEIDLVEEPDREFGDPGSRRRRRATFS